MICEKCESEHDGKYGSGRFCSIKCARAFSTYENRKAISEKIRASLLGKPLTDKHPHKLGSIWTDELKEKSKVSRRARLASINPEARRKAAETFSKNRFDLLITRPFEEIKGKKSRKKRILHEQNNECTICGMKDTWQGKTLIFELDHIDGNNENNLRDNLRLVCPNCHSQTDTYCGRNKSLLKSKTDI